MTRACPETMPSARMIQALCNCTTAYMTSACLVLSPPAATRTSMWPASVERVALSHKIGVDLALGSTNARSVRRSSLSDHGARVAFAVYGNLCVIPHFANPFR